MADSVMPAKAGIYLRAGAINLRRPALLAALAVPFGLLHVWVLAELCIAITDLLFLAEMARRRDASWARQPWFLAASLWWGWIVVCSLPLPGWLTDGWVMGLGEALVIVRLIVFAAALQHWLLTTAAAQRAAWVMLALSCLWIGLESWQQFLTGRNLFGDGRWGDGSLTGPFYKPRAGDLYGHLLFVALLPPVFRAFARSRLAAGALAVLGVATSLLIGQRMGFLFTALGLVTAALLLPRLRAVAALTIAAALLLLLATPIISPPTYAKLVGETSVNLGHFALSPYGELYTRASVMGLASPLHGFGYNSFRAFCRLPEFSGGLPALGIAPTSLALAACNLHPHNFYLQAFVDGGFPGIILFAAMMLTWLVSLFQGLWRRPDPLRAGLFACLVTFAWPLASTDAFPTLYMSGWLFFALGLGLARAQIGAEPRMDPSNA